MGEHKMDYYLITVLCNFCLLLVIRRLTSDFLETVSENRTFTKIFSILWFLGTFLANEFFHITVLNLTVNLLLIFLIVCTYNGKLWKKILVSVFISVLSASCDMLSYAIMMPILGKENYFYSFILTVIFMMLIERAFGIILRRGCAWQILSKEMILLSLFPVFAAVILYCVTVMSGGIYQMVASIAVVAIIILSMVLFNSLSYNFEEKLKQENLQKEVEAYQRELETMQLSDRNLQNFRHDLRHHLIELEGMARQGENENIGVYIQEMRTRFADGKRAVCTGEHEIDSLVNYLIEDAKNRQVNVATDVKLPEDLKLSQYRLNIIVGNLLENAIEAAAKSPERMVFFSMRYSGGILYLQIKNTFEGTICVRNGAVVGRSKMKGHGIGLRSVRDLVNEQGGKMEISAEGNLFIAEVMIAPL